MTASTATSLRAILGDQLAFLADGAHSRVVDETNGRDSLQMSVDATRLARGA